MTGALKARTLIQRTLKGLSTGHGRVAVFVALAVVLSACGDTKDLLGRGKRTPDEFAVYSRAPLTLPPDYGLRPPVPGAGRPQDVQPREVAKATVLGVGPAPAVGAPDQQIKPGEVSTGTMAILERTGALEANPGIRDVVNRESAILAEEDKSLAERIIFWGVDSEHGTLVDPTEEARRIQENQALGQPVTEGETPTIERRRRAILEGIF